MMPQTPAIVAITAAAELTAASQLGAAIRWLAALGRRWLAVASGRFRGLAARLEGGRL